LKNKTKNIKRIKIFYINLKGRKDRLKFIKNQLRKNNLKGHRVEGIEPSRLDKKIINKNKKYLTPSGIALCLVHKNIWLNIVKKNINYALILEDDALISKRLKIFMNEAKKILDNKKIDIININTHELPTKVGKLKFHFKKINTGLYDLISTEYGTAGYIISKEGAKKLINDKDFLKLQIDLYLFSKKSKISRKLKIYQALPALTIPLASIKFEQNILKYHNFKNIKIFQKTAMSSSDYNNYINKNKIIQVSNILGNFLKNFFNIKSLKIGEIYFFLKHYLNILISNRQYKIIFNKFKN
tara:strand:- start:1357 stop:2253 length:897 start_codon:yes stop_codon:yes gene_type:complete